MTTDSRLVQTARNHASNLNTTTYTTMDKESLRPTVGTQVSSSEHVGGPIRRGDTTA